MKRNFEPTTPRARATSAIAAALVALLIGSGIDGLVDHYQGTTQTASTAPLALAQR